MFLYMPFFCNANFLSHSLCGTMTRAQPEMFTKQKTYKPKKIAAPSMCKTNVPMPSVQHLYCNPSTLLPQCLPTIALQLCETLEWVALWLTSHSAGGQCCSERWCHWVLCLHTHHARKGHSDEWSCAEHIEQVGSWLDPLSGTQEVPQGFENDVWGSQKSFQWCCKQMSGAG